MEDSALWFMLCVGFWLGFGFRRFGEKRAARHDPPASWNAFAARVVDYARKVEEGHRFAGPDVTVTARFSFKVDRVGNFAVTMVRDQTDA